MPLRCLTANAIEVLVTVHVCYFDQEWWKTTLVHHSFAGILRGPLTIRHFKW